MPYTAAAFCTDAEPPLEEHLCQNTLWPEVRKLFGHGNNVQALASCGSLLASAAESKTADLADIWLWDTQVCWYACGARFRAILTSIGHIHWVSTVLMLHSCDIMSAACLQLSLDWHQTDRDERAACRHGHV